MNAAAASKAPRQARGSYSKLICLNCRSRKIKCILPVQDDSIQPSGSPQPPDKACIRCQQQSLECIIDKTILGRPSSKRKQTAQQEDLVRINNKSANNDTIAAEEELVNPDDVELSGFVLAEVEEEIDQVASHLPRRDKPEDHERYQALIDSYHLMSTVIGRDKKFGAACNLSLGSAAPDPMRAIQGPLIDILDARLVWVRLYFPYVPTIASLLKETIAPSAEAGAPAASTKALVLILTLIAMDARCAEPLPEQPDRSAITSALAKCGLELLFTPPGHRHTIYALELIMEYWPTALVAGQNAAAACLKGELYVTLMKRLGERLRLETSSKTLRAKLSSSTAPTEEILQLVYDALLWARICYLDISIGALITKQPVELAEYKMKLEEATSAVIIAFQRYLHLPPASKFLYMRIVTRASEMQAYSDIKSHRSDLLFLGTIMTSHARTAAEQKRTCANLLERHKNSPEIQAIKELVGYDADYMHLNVSQHVISYTIFSGFVSHDQDPTMEDVLQISDQIIHHIKTGQSWDSPSSFATEDILTLGIPGFLARFAPARPGEICQVLRYFNARNLKLNLNGVAWQPPSREITATILYQCKMVVEENAARMKGWGWLCEDVDTQLLLLEDCARGLEAMDIQTKEGGPSSLEEGSLSAAAPKLIRSLATIVRSWKNRLLERQRKLIAAGQVPNSSSSSSVLGPEAIVTSPQTVVNVDTWLAAERAAMRERPLRVADNADAYSAVDNTWNSANPYGWTEVNFDDWAAWPQANPVESLWEMLPREDINNALNTNDFGYG